MRQKIRCEGYEPRYSFRTITAQGISAPTKPRNVLRTGVASDGQPSSPARSKSEHCNQIGNPFTTNVAVSPTVQHTSSISPNPSVSNVSNTEPNGPPESIYLAHYVNLKMRLPQSIVPSVERFRAQPLVRNALLALTASDLAHSHDRVWEEEGRMFLKKPSYGNDHLANGVRFYTAAIQMLHAEEVCLAQPEERLAAVTLCCLFERRSGSPRGQYTHWRGAQAIVASHFHEISMNPTGRSMLCGWAELHAYWEANKLPFRMLELEKKGSLIRTVAQAFADRKGTAYGLYSDACAIHSRLNLVHCMGQEGEAMEVVVQRARVWYQANFPEMVRLEDDVHPETFLSISDLQHTIQHLHRLLDAWRDSMSLDDPLDAIGCSVLDKTLQPLSFKSSSIAVSCLYYATARLLLCDEAIPHSNSCLDTDRPINPWAYLVLRIFAGMDFSNAALFSPYEETIIWVLWTASNACPDQRVTAYLLEEMFPRLEETSCPLALAAIALYKPFFHVLHDQLRKGLRPYLLKFPTPADKELGSDESELVAIHARDLQGRVIHMTGKIPIQCPSNDSTHRLSLRDGTK